MISTVVPINNNIKEHRMTQKRTLLKYGILSLALAAPLSACAFDSLTVIGDSLSDTGNNGRWTSIVVKISSTTNSWPNDMGWN